jgi:hypothetical protein
MEQGKTNENFREGGEYAGNRVTRKRASVGWEKYTYVLAHRILKVRNSSDN